MIGLGYGRRLSKQSCLWFSIKLHYLCTMTYLEAQSYLNCINEFTIGILVKRTIEHLSIGPTDWEEMTGFMNLRIRKGEEAALMEYDSLGKSLSVYGVSVEDSGGIPHWEMTIMDSWELTLTN